MSDDWKPGDLALCVRGGKNTRAGAVYTVLQVSAPGQWDDGFLTDTPYPMLRFCGMKYHLGGWSASTRFRKIRPHTPDAEDAETIRLLNGKPVWERVS